MDDFDGPIDANGSSAFLVESWLDPSESKIKSLWEWHRPTETPLRISISGVAGTGKKKLAKALERRLEITPITSVARTAKGLGASLNKQANMSDEFMILLAQLFEESEYTEFVTAGSIIDVLAHMKYVADQSGSKKDQLTLRAATNLGNQHCNNAYTVVFYLPHRSKPKADGTRSVDSKYLSDIDTNIKFYLNAFDLDYFPVDGSTLERADIAVNYMNDFNLLDDR